MEDKQVNITFKERFLNTCDFIKDLNKHATDALITMIKDDLAYLNDGRCITLDSNYISYRRQFETSVQTVVLRYFYMHTLRKKKS